MSLRTLVSSRGVIFGAGLAFTVCVRNVRLPVRCSASASKPSVSSENRSRFFFMRLPHPQFLAIHVVQSQAAAFALGSSSIAKPEFPEAAPFPRLDRQLPHWPSTCLASARSRHHQHARAVGR